MDNRDLAKLGRICRAMKYLVLLLTVLSVAFCLIILFLIIIAAITPVFPDSEYTRDSFIIAMCFFATMVATLTYSLFCVFRITRSLGESDTPFTMDNRRLLGRISAVLAVSAVLSLAEGGVSYIAGYPPDSGMWMIVSILTISSISVYVLTLVFEYGVRLQTESDSFV